MSNQPSPGDLTKLMLFFGKVPETHIESLKGFPFIFFNGLKEAKIEHDIYTTKENPGLISYHLTLSEINYNLDKRYLALESAIRSLFWKEIKLNLSINGEEVFKSE